MYWKIYLSNIAETIRKAVKSEGKFVRQSGGRGQYGHCWFEINSSRTRYWLQFENKGLELVQFLVNTSDHE